MAQGWLFGERGTVRDREKGGKEGERGRESGREWGSEREGERGDQRNTNYFKIMTLTNAAKEAIRSSGKPSLKKWRMGES